jgi:hypothetical protein
MLGMSEKIAVEIKPRAVKGIVSITPMTTSEYW